MCIEQTNMELAQGAWLLIPQSKHRQNENHENE